MRQKIFVVFERNLSSLPPLLSLIEIISKHYDVSVSVSIKENEYVTYFPNVKFINYCKMRIATNKVDKIINKLKKYLLFYRFIKKYIQSEKPDIIWIGSAEACILLKPIEKYLVTKRYIINIYELYDRKPKVLKKISFLAQNAQKVLVPEYNRANILRLWLGLKETPVVIPNKSILHPRRKKLPIPHNIEEKISGKKIILYQGHITSDRNIDVLCETVHDLSEFILVLMGDGDDYLNKLKKIYPYVIFIDFIKPPRHLAITSWAYIGIVTYEFYSLNTIYCAPNKIWEYSGFGIPIIANDIPGLKFTVDISKSGLCINMKDKEQIKNSILFIDENYNYFSENSLSMFEKEDIENKVVNVLKGL
jgi:glycosyltransferase involved in cell wall biosynthesis